MELILSEPASSAPVTVVVGQWLTAGCAGGAVVFSKFGVLKVFLIISMAAACSVVNLTLVRGGRFGMNGKLAGFGRGLVTFSRLWAG